MGSDDYGLWFLVVVNTALVLVFAASFFHPRTKTDWRVMGGFSAFVLALFVEMYGLPFTVYLLSGWLGSRFDVFAVTHESGHLWSELIGWRGDPHLSPFHLASYAAIAAGFWQLAKAWPVLLGAVGTGTLATSGPYARVRHPQYAAFLLIMVGFLLQWPTLPTLLMFPVLVVVYRRLAVTEERELARRFGPVWEAYAGATPRFIPRLSASPRVGAAGVVETTSDTWRDPVRVPRGGGIDDGEEDP